MLLKNTFVINQLLNYWTSSVMFSLTFKLLYTEQMAFWNIHGPSKGQQEKENEKPDAESTETFPVHWFMFGT